MDKIAVFDSGFGGLTVLRALLEVVPRAEYLYFGDTARLPYGSKSVETVAKYACEAARFLEREGAGLLVVACNTATALALEEVRQGVSIVVLGVVEPGAEQASARSRSRKAVVIGTEATIASRAYRQALERRRMDACEKACPLLVPLVEEGWTDHPVTEQVARIYLEEAFADGFRAADVLVLGCTHYPLLKPLLGRIVPENVTLVDSAASTAVAVARALGEHGDSPAGPGESSRLAEDSVRFFVTDSVGKFERLGERFLGRPIANVTHVRLME